MLYILGYSGWTPQAIQETVQTLNAVVCDIRYSPASHHPQWSKRQIAQLLFPPRPMPLRHHGDGVGPRGQRLHALEGAGEE